MSTLAEILLLATSLGLLAFPGLRSASAMVLFGILWLAVNGRYLWYWHKSGVLSARTSELSTVMERIPRTNALTKIALVAGAVAFVVLIVSA